MARVKVVLRQRVEKLGDVGDVTAVAAGFARNYLIPRGLAVPATKGNVKQAQTWRRSVVERAGRELAGAQEVKARLEAAQLKLTVQAGPDGRLFGSVTAAQIAEAAQAATGIEVDRHAVHLEEPIRHLGVHDVEVKLHPEVTARLSVEVGGMGE